MDTLIFSQAVVGSELSCRARRLSPNTIQDYMRTLKKFRAFLEIDLPVSQITSRQIEAFLASQRVAKKSLLNYYVGLSALWTWCIAENVAEKNVVRVVRQPKPESRKIDPFTMDQIRALLNALKRSRTYARPGSGKIDHELQHPERNRAIILMLLDTGMRASELCNLTMGDVDIDNGRLHVRHGKGDKERFIPFSGRTGQALWRYLATREQPRRDEPLFCTRNQRHLSRTELAHILGNIGKRADVMNVHPHRFRHTFAINYIRNGGDPFTLQEILGHSTMEIVKLYLKLAETDLMSAHRRASPVDNWRL